MILVSFQPEFIPILKELNGMEIVTMHPQFTRMLNEIDIPAKTISDFITSDIAEKSKSVSAFAMLDYFQYEFSSDIDTQTYTWLVNNMPGYLYGRLPDMALVLLTLSKIKPSLILLHNDVEPMNRLLAMYAKNSNIPCLHVPHAIYLENGGRGKTGTDIHDLVTASDIVVSGEYQAKWYIDRGIDPGHVYVCGLPKHDNYVSSNITKEHACKLLSQDINRPVITYCSSWRQDTNLLGCHDGVEESYIEFLEAAKQLPEAQYIIKCHPRGNNTEWHKKLAKESGIKCVVLQDHIEIVLAASDLVISYGASNVVLEAILRNYCRVAIIGDELAMPNDNEITKIKNGELVDSIKLILSNPVPDYSRIVKKYYSALDGRSSSRIAELIKFLYR